MEAKIKPVTSQEEERREEERPTDTMNDPGAVYAAAVYLNNTAILMMERSCLVEGVETITDALKTMKTSLNNSNDFVYHSSIEKATRRASALPSSSSGIITLVTHNIGDYALHQDSYSVLKAPQRRIMIQIDTSDADFLNEDQEIDLLNAIIYHNYATSLLICGEQCQDRKDEYAAHFLCKAIESFLPMLQRAQEDLFMMKRVIFIQLIVLFALVPVLQAIGQLEEAEVLSMELNYLYSVAASLDQSGLFPRSLEGAASAA
jgi:hypothetical protein